MNAAKCRSRSLNALLAMSWRISVMCRALLSSRTGQEVVESADKGFLQPVAKYAVSGPGEIDAAQEQIIDAAEMLLVAVAGQAQAEIAIQRGSVELVLEVIVSAADLACECGWAVMLDACAEQVGLPVHEVVAALELEHQVYEALEHSLDRDEGESARLGATGVVGARNRVLAEQSAEHVRRDTLEREIEFEFVQPLCRRDLRQGETGDAWVQRGGHHLAQRFDEDVSELGCRQAMSVKLFLHECVGRRLIPLVKFQLLENLVQASTRLGATGAREDAEGGRLAAPAGPQRVVIRQLFIPVGGKGGEAADAPVAGNDAGEPPVIQSRPR